MRANRRFRHSEEPWEPPVLHAYANQWRFVEPPPDEQVFVWLDIDEIISNAKRLKYRERCVIELSFGINLGGVGNNYEYTDREIGRIFRVSEERIRQIKVKALNKLKRLARKAVP